MRCDSPRCERRAARSTDVTPREYRQRCWSEPTCASLAFREVPAGQIGELHGEVASASFPSAGNVAATSSRVCAVPRSGKPANTASFMSSMVTRPVFRRHRGRTSQFTMAWNPAPHRHCAARGHGFGHRPSTFATASDPKLLGEIRWPDTTIPGVARKNRPSISGSIARALGHWR